MLRLSKRQFSRAIEGKSGIANTPVMPPERNGQVRSSNKSKRASKVIVTALMVFLGIGAGWMGGKALNARSHSTDATTPSDVPTGDNPASTGQSQPESRPIKHAATETATTPPEPAPEVEQPTIPTEPRPKEAEPKEAPPKVPRVEKDEEADKPTPEDPSKAVGREALKKMAKETKKMQRGPGNKNGSEDRQ